MELKVSSSIFPRCFPNLDPIGTILDSQINAKTGSYTVAIPIAKNQNHQQQFYFKANLKFFEIRMHIISTIVP